jgi:PAS domain S-box-containing protein
MQIAAEMSQNEQYANLANDIFSRLFDLYGVLDASGRVIEIDGSLFAHTAIEPQLLQNQVFPETAFWQSSEANSRAVTSAFETAGKGEFSRIKADFRASSKVKLPVELSFVPAGNENRIYVFAKSADVPKKKRTTASDVSEKLLFAAESAGIGLWYLSFADDKIRSTPEFDRILGLQSGGGLTFAKFLDAIHPDDRARVREFISNAMHSGEPFEHAFRIVTQDGDTEWVSAEGRSYISAAGKPETIVGVVRRVTEERLAAENLESVYEREKAARDEAELANRSKDIFLAFVSHELRAPLNSILGWANILLTKEVDEKTHRNAIETIERSARMQTKLINDLVDSARVASGKIKLEYRPTEIITVVKNVVDAQRPALDARGLNYSTAFEPVRTYVMGDANRLQQVFGNLISNAIKFTPPGGEISIATSRRDSRVEVVIADSGEGISADSLPTIFRQFSQVGAGEKKSVGLGLGLSIAKTLVERHGGTVRAESEGVGKGSRFVVSLPLLESAQLEKVSGALEAPTSQKLLAGLTILVIEDEKDSREVLRLYLESKGATVHPAENSGAALRILDGLDPAPNLIVSDIGMPDEDGISLIKRIRASEVPAVAATPAIALSAFATGEFKSHAIEAGFQRYVAKPFDPKTFAQVVIEVARKG